MKLRLLDAAQRDIAETAEYYDSRQRGLGDKFIDTVESTLLRIEVSPESFAPLETLPAAFGYRRARLLPFRYVAIYRITNDEVVVSAVVHTSRKPNFWLLRKE